jgi:hypothetical protein
MLPAERNNQLKRLEDHINLLHATIKSSNWDALPAVTERLEALLDDLRRDSSIKPTDKGSPADEASAIRRMLALLETAHELCGERQRQIAPLIEALARPGNSTPSA